MKAMTAMYTHIHTTEKQDDFWLRNQARFYGDGI